MFFRVQSAFRHIGLDAIILCQGKKAALAQGYKTVEGCMMPEDNWRILQECATMGAQTYKTWRIYDLDL